MPIFLYIDRTVVVEPMAVAIGSPNLQVNLEEESHDFRG